MTTPKYLPHDPSGYAEYTPDGRQIRGGALPIKPEEMRRLQTSYDFDARTFDLGNAEDLKAYKDVMDRVCNRELVMVGKPVEPSWNSDTKSYHVFVRWARPYAEPPNYLRTTK